MGANAVFIFAATRRQLYAILASKDCVWDAIFQAPSFRGIEPLEYERCSASLIISYAPIDSTDGFVHMYLTAPRFSSIIDDGIYCKGVIRDLIGYFPSKIEMWSDYDHSRPKPPKSVISLGSHLMSEQWRKIGKPFTVIDPYSRSDKLEETSPEQVATSSVLWELVYRILQLQSPSKDEPTIRIRALHYPGLQDVGPELLRKMIASPIDEQGSITELLTPFSNSTTTSDSTNREPKRCFFCAEPGANWLLSLENATVLVCQSCEFGNCGKCDKRWSKSMMRYSKELGYSVCARCRAPNETQCC